MRERVCVCSRMYRRDDGWISIHVQSRDAHRGFINGTRLSKGREEREWCVESDNDAISG